MRIHIVLTDSSGAVFEGDAELTPASGKLIPRRVPLPRTKKTDSAPTGTLDFDLPVRAFVKRHARGLSGPKRFTLLLARLAGGKIGQAVPTKNVERQWNSMTEPMGGAFNPAYQTRARDEGWIDFPTGGSAVLRKEWKGVLN